MPKRITIKIEETTVIEDVTVEGDLTPDELGPVMAALLHTTLGDEPSMGDIVKIQQTMMGALSK